MFESEFLIGLQCACSAQHAETVAPASSEILQPMYAQSSVWVAISPRLPEDFSDSPESIAAQFSKWMLPQAREAMYSPGVVTAVQGMAEAKKNGSDYLIMLELEKWKSPSLSGPSHEASLLIKVTEVSTGEVLMQSDLNATCYLMAVVVGMSTRECIRPEVNKWKEHAFKPKKVSVHTNSEPERSK
ncbi:MAG: peptide synthetase [Desulfovibrio sp.]|uniref:peptide synthetase n=1 Tax=Desulfovibrio sp. TaxID=885 RepID=UPI0039E6E2C9